MMKICSLCYKNSCECTDRLREIIICIIEIKQADNEIIQIKKMIEEEMIDLEEINNMIKEFLLNQENILFFKKKSLHKFRSLKNINIEANISLHKKKIIQWIQKKTGNYQ